MKTRITYKQIAEILGKKEQTIKGWKNKSPILLELVKLGALCKLHNLNEAKITQFLQEDTTFDKVKSDEKK